MELLHQENSESSALVTSSLAEGALGQSYVRALSEPLWKECTNREVFVSMSDCVSTLTHRWTGACMCTSAPACQLPVMSVCTQVCVCVPSLCVCSFGLSHSPKDSHPVTVQILVS